MSLELISTPEKTINNILSNVNGARSQLPYTFQRYDYSFALYETSSFWGGTFTPLINLNPPDVNNTSLLPAVGEFITVSDIIVDGVLRVKGGSYEIQAKDYVQNGTGSFYTRMNLKTEDLVGGKSRTDLIDYGYTFINDKKNYKVGVEIRNGANDGQLIPIIFKYSPDPTGKLFIDVGSLLTELHEETEQLSIEYILRFQELYEGFTSGWTATPKIQSIYAEKQLLDKGGSNMFEWLLREYKEQSGYAINFSDNGAEKVNIALNDSSLFVVGDWVRVISEGGQDITGRVYEVDNPERNPPNIQLEFVTTFYDVSPNIVFSANGKAKLLTSFEEGFVWNGFTRLYNFLIDSNVQSRLISPIRPLERILDINKVRIDLNSGSNFHSQAPNVYYLPLINVQPNTPETAYRSITMISPDSTSFVSEEKFYRLLEPCDNPVYVGWVSSKGGFEQHLFSYNQIVDRTVEEGLLAESVINQDIEVVDRTKKRLPNTWTEQIILETDGLKLDQLKALQEIKQSDYVVLYLSKDLQKRVFVVVSNGYSQQYDTKEDLYSFQLQVELPDNFDFFKAKEY